MADDILKDIPLPADLPENWTSGQIIAPTGAEAGLDEQHGYNYLMRQVNNAQKALKVLAAQREEDRAKIKFWVSPDPTSPASFIGGTWEQIKDCFILAAGDTYAAGSTGGEATHTLTVTELPAHSFSISGLGLSGKGSGRIRIRSQNDGNFVVEDSGGVIWSSGVVTSKNAEYSYFTVGDGSTNTSTLGDSQPHNNMPPYLTVYIWKRIA